MYTPAARSHAYVASNCDPIQYLSATNRDSVQTEPKNNYFNDSVSQCY